MKKQQSQASRQHRSAQCTRSKRTLKAMKRLYRLLENAPALCVERPSDAAMIRDYLAYRERLQAVRMPDAQWWALALDCYRQAVEIRERIEAGGIEIVGGVE